MSDENYGGWRVMVVGHHKHVVPAGEELQHFPADCVCGAKPDPEDATVIVHNAFDGREYFERGERQTS